MGYAMNINNEVYSTMADYWWDDDGCGTLATIRFFGNDVRFSFFKKILDEKFRNTYQDMSILDVGCGGGFLAEEFARIGLDVIGIDPSKESIEIAQKHARDNNLRIQYIHGYGESLPFESDSFNLVSCCDVFEHVSDLNLVVKEISRVLQPDGILFYDTVNRSLIGKLIIKATQEWKSTSFMEPDVHVWDMFIKPKELIQTFNNYKLKNIELKGMLPGLNLFAHYLNLRRCKKSKISFTELGKRLHITINNNTSGPYIGYAIKY